MPYFALIIMFYHVKIACYQTPSRQGWWRNGSHERQDVNYDETFTLVVMIKSIRILLTIVVHYDYKI